MATRMKERLLKAGSTPRTAPAPWPISLYWQLCSHQTTAWRWLLAAGRPATSCWKAHVRIPAAVQVQVCVWFLSVWCGLSWCPLFIKLQTERQQIYSLNSLGILVISLHPSFGQCLNSLSCFTSILVWCAASSGNISVSLTIAKSKFFFFAEFLSAKHKTHR